MCPVSDRIVPTEPGWWWRLDYHDDAEPRQVIRTTPRGPLRLVVSDGPHAGVALVDVYDDGRWLALVATLDEVADLRARLAAAEAVVASLVSAHDHYCEADGVNAWTVEPCDECPVCGGLGTTCRTNRPMRVLIGEVDRV